MGEQKVQWKQKRKVIQTSASVFQYTVIGDLSIPRKGEREPGQKKPLGIFGK